MPFNVLQEKQRAVWTAPEVSDYIFLPSGLRMSSHVLLHMLCKSSNASLVRQQGLHVSFVVPKGLGGLWCAPKVPMSVYT